MNINALTTSHGDCHISAKANSIAHPNRETTFTTKRFYLPDRNRLQTRLLWKQI